MFGKAKYQEINRLLNERLEEKKTLIAVHRGSSGGNIIQNTIPAYQNALNMGADMFEMDVNSSTDGVLYTFHDGTENINFHTTQNIKTMSSQTIDALTYYNSIGHACSYKPERLEAVLKHFCGDELFNIDRAWDIFPQVADMLKQYPNTINRAVLKSPVTKNVLEFLNQCPDKYMYMPICYSMKDVETVLQYEDINTVGAEVIARTREDELFDDAALQRIHELGLFIWVNAITLDDEHVLFGRLDDDASIIKGPEFGWGRLFEKQIDILQTDWPSLLYQYRRSYFQTQ